MVMLTPLNAPIVPTIATLAIQLETVSPATKQPTSELLTLPKDVFPFLATSIISPQSVSGVPPVAQFVPMLHSAPTASPTSTSGLINFATILA